MLKELINLFVIIKVMENLTMKTKWWIQLMHQETTVKILSAMTKEKEPILKMLAKSAAVLRTKDQVNQMKKVENLNKAKRNI